MTLFEITNGWIGESFVRVYAWANNEADALRMAKVKFDQKYTTRPNTLTASKLFDGSSAEFVTMPSDCGFEMEN